MILTNSFSPSQSAWSTVNRFSLPGIPWGSGSFSVQWVLEVCVLDAQDVVFQDRHYLRVGNTESWVCPPQIRCNKSPRWLVCTVKFVKSCSIHKGVHSLASVQACLHLAQLAFQPYFLFLLCYSTAKQNTNSTGPLRILWFELMCPFITSLRVKAIPMF